MHLNFIIDSNTIIKLLSGDGNDTTTDKSPKY